MDEERATDVSDLEGLRDQATLQGLPVPVLGLIIRATRSSPAQFGAINLACRATHAALPDAFSGGVSGSSSPVDGNTSGTFIDAVDQAWPQGAHTLRSTQPVLHLNLASHSSDTTGMRLYEALAVSLRRTAARFSRAPVVHLHLGRSTRSAALFSQACAPSLQGVQQLCIEAPSPSHLPLLVWSPALARLARGVRELSVVGHHTVVAQIAATLPEHFPSLVALSLTLDTSTRDGTAQHAPSCDRLLIAVPSGLRVLLMRAEEDSFMSLLSYIRSLPPFHLVVEGSPGHLQTLRCHTWWRASHGVQHVRGERVPVRGLRLSGCLPALRTLDIPLSCDDEECILAAVSEVCPGLVRLVAHCGRLDDTFDDEVPFAARLAWLAPLAPTLRRIQLWHHSPHEMVKGAQYADAWAAMQRASALHLPSARLSVNQAHAGRPPQDPSTAPMTLARLAAMSDGDCQDALRRHMRLAVAQVHDGEDGLSVEEAVDQLLARDLPIETVWALTNDAVRLQSSVDMMSGECKHRAAISRRSPEDALQRPLDAVALEAASQLQLAHFLEERLVLAVAEVQPTLTHLIARMLQQRDIEPLLLLLYNPDALCQAVFDAAKWLHGVARACILQEGAVLSSEILAACRPVERSQRLADHLVPAMAQHHFDGGARSTAITGMLLELDTDELLVLLHNREALLRRVAEVTLWVQPPGPAPAVHAQSELATIAAFATARPLMRQALAAAVSPMAGRNLVAPYVAQVGAKIGRMMGGDLGAVAGILMDRNIEELMALLGSTQAFLSSVDTALARLKGLHVQGLSLDALAGLSSERRRETIGAHLFPEVAKLQPLLAGKITGMLLERSDAELVDLLGSNTELQREVQAAIDVLKQHGMADG